MRGRISEIFESIQGEGSYQGIDQVFVRFFDCNLKCEFCDTGLEHYVEMDINELLVKINSYSGYHSVSLTGGEPLLEISFLQELAKALKKEGKIVYLETNGTLPQHLREVIDYVDIIAMDFKLPSSTGLKGFWFQHREFLKVARTKEVFVKAVIGESTLIEDVRVAMSIIKEAGGSLSFILQPQNPFEDILQKKIEYFEKICRENNIDVKVISQLHKRIGVK